MKKRGINIGLAIEQRINELGVSRSELAKRLGIANQNVKKLILDREHMDTDKLEEICRALDFDFFKLYSEAMSGEQPKTVEDGDVTVGDTSASTVNVNGSHSPNVTQTAGQADALERENKILRQHSEFLQKQNESLQKQNESLQKQVGTLINIMGEQK